MGEGRTRTTFPPGLPPRLSVEVRDSLKEIEYPATPLLTKEGWQPLRLTRWFSVGTQAPRLQRHAAVAVSVFQLEKVLRVNPVPKPDLRRLETGIEHRVLPIAVPKPHRRNRACRARDSSDCEMTFRRQPSGEHG